MYLLCYDIFQKHWLVRLALLSGFASLVRFVVFSGLSKEVLVAVIDAAVTLAYLGHGLKYLFLHLA